MKSMAADRSLGCPFVSIACSLAAVAWLTVFVLSVDEAKLEEIEQAQRASYSRVPVARAVFRHGGVEGVATFRRGSQQTKLVLGVTGLEPSLEYDWQIVRGGEAACIDGRYRPAAAAATDRGGGSSHDLTAEHGPLQPMARDAGGASFVARVVYDRRLRFSGAQSILGSTLVLRSPQQRQARLGDDRSAPCAPIQLAAAAAAEGPPRGACIFDVDMTLTCGGDCASADCEYADPVAGGACLDTAVTSGWRDGYPLRFNRLGTEAVLAWCSAKGFVPAVATHGSRAEVEHVGACGMSKMEYVKELLGIGSEVACQDVRDLMAMEAAGSATDATDAGAGGSRCVYGGSSWSESGGQAQKVTKDNHVRAILRSFSADATAASSSSSSSMEDEEEEEEEERWRTAAEGFKVVFFDDGLANQRDVLSGNASYHMILRRGSSSGEQDMLEVEVGIGGLAVTFPNSDTVASAGGWGNPNSCGLVAPELRGLGAQPAEGWALTARGP
jgi:hypothetical protein